ncbi:hypothetical protein [Methylomonas koyamae]|uniref:hypothetical protein n=1 Tax=Methylomonas koyamae TaxID=702114 RepID=UPI0011288F85|nr:hypothetical protein [Methylomonas koyamae]
MVNTILLVNESPAEPSAFNSCLTRFEASPHPDSRHLPEQTRPTQDMPDKTSDIKTFASSFILDNGLYQKLLGNLSRMYPIVAAITPQTQGTGVLTVRAKS